LEGRQTPVAAGADVSGGYYREALGLPDELVYWPEPVAAMPAPMEAALDLLKQSIDQGAIIIGIGPYTNLRLLDERYPGLLAQAKLCLMGGYLAPPRAGYPAWGNEMDFNVQVDAVSAQHVLTHADPLLVPLTVTVETALRRAYLDDLRQAGALGQLIARQAEAFAEENGNEARFGATCAGSPRDVINFQHDGLACAAALGWAGVRIETQPLAIDMRDGWLVERTAPGGKPTRVVTAVAGERFGDFWREVVTGKTERQAVHRGGRGER
jgi:inosine-uridine nucleoside N-ribohydrolase